jgi:hypothetical protein
MYPADRRKQVNHRHINLVSRALKGMRGGTATGPAPGAEVGNGVVELDGKKKKLPRPVSTGREVE